MQFFLEGKKVFCYLKKKKQLSSGYKKVLSELEMISHSKKISKYLKKKNNVKSQDYISQTKKDVLKNF